jgi:ribonuclease BN (tRNA processing enzyme)
MQFRAISVGEAVKIGGRTITALSAAHTVPAVGYRVDNALASLAFTGDATSCDELWEALNEIGNLRYLIIETAFAEREKKLAALSKHLVPACLRTN